MIKWPQKGFKALVKLFEPLQDIDVYVEDSRDEVFYTSVLRRLAGDEVRIARVFSPPVNGGRSTVIAAAKAHDHTKRRALFLIDGDLEYSKGDPPPQNVKGLYRLDAYCIENFLFCARAAAVLLREESIIEPADAEAKLDFDTWTSQLQEPLLSLFRSFCLIHQLDPTCPTVSVGVGPYCEQVGKVTSLSPTKVSAAILRISTQASAHATQDHIEELLARYSARMKNLTNPLRIVSGKDFLLPLLAFRLSSLGCKVPKDRLRFRLGLHCDLEALQPLLQEMRRVAKGV